MKLKHCEEAINADMFVFPISSDAYKTKEQIELHDLATTLNVRNWLYYEVRGYDPHANGSRSFHFRIDTYTRQVECEMYDGDWSHYAASYQYQMGWECYRIADDMYDKG